MASTSIKHRLRMAVRRLGVDLARWPASDPLWRVAQLLERQNVDLVLDVGANDGGFAATIRGHGYAGRIVSFEPLTQPYRRLEQHAAADPRWETRQIALGATSGEITMNIAGNDEASSSVLPMLDAHRNAAPQAVYVGTETVRQARLDELRSELGGKRIYLKIDVQGYEAAVLAGGADLLADPALVGLQMEISFVPLYEGGMTWQEGLLVGERLGMNLVGLAPAFMTPDGRTLQGDVVFLRQG